VARDVLNALAMAITKRKKVGVSKKRGGLDDKQPVAVAKSEKVAKADTADKVARVAARAEKAAAKAAKADKKPKKLSKAELLARRNEYAAKFFPYIEKVARRLARRLPAHVEIDDLISSGVIGLIEAAERFDPERVDRFEAFAEFRIRGAMLDELRSRDSLSRDMRRICRELQEATSNLANQLSVSVQNACGLFPFFSSKSLLASTRSIGSPMPA